MKDVSSVCGRNSLNIGLFFSKRESRARVPSSKKVRKLVSSESDISVTWEDYYSLVKSQERRSLSNGYEIHVFEHPERSYIQEIDKCQSLFKQHQSFSNIPKDGRKLISGFGGGTSGYLGGMKGAGIFKNIVNQQPNRIGEKLDKIPSEGTVTEKHIIEYLNKMLGITGIDLGSATRLLAVKRPGLFLPVNGGNKPKIRQIFGKAPASVSGYVNLINKIWKFPWFGAGIPHSTYEKKIWSYRVAILDAILYEHPVSKKNENA